MACSHGPAHLRCLFRNFPARRPSERHLPLWGQSSTILPQTMAQHDCTPGHQAQTADASSQVTADDLHSAIRKVKEELLQSFHDEYSSLKNILLEMREDLGKVVSNTEPPTPPPPQVEDTHPHSGSPHVHTLPNIPPPPPLSSWFPPESWNVDDPV